MNKPEFARQRLLSRYLEPSDAADGCFVGRAWVPSTAGFPGGPSVIVLRADGVYDISQAVSTMSELLDMPEPSRFAHHAAGELLGPLSVLLSNSDPHEHRDDRPWLLAPVIVLAAVVGSFQLVFEREDYSA